ncbi:hypothetical protein DL764_001428 [Monosporascus ibericus]|uniref:Sec20 C-terminal domain-containing protein n=1 Tax=Monosporascus ibericus TaxID=155417 RepID=A0A4Q4TRB0_9PEZI|nr:hypothetical protein DL764_001428 [Monosporascus ibericus]
MSPETLDKRFKDLQDRLTALQDATNQLRELIDRLANLNFQPGSVPLAAGEDDNVASELSTEVNQILREQEEDLELLQEEITDIRPGKPGSALQHDRERLKDGATRLAQELQSCRSYLRKAQIAAKRNLEAAQRQERELLYASFASPRSGASSPAAAQAPPLRRKQLRSAEMSKEDRIVGASHDVTQSLRQTHDLMASELSRSEFAHRTLKESTMALAELSESYSNLDTLLSTSRDLLGTLFKSQKTDTWYLETSFYLLLCTIAWLIFRRWLYGPMWWLVWLPLKLLFQGAVGLSKAVAPRGSSQVDPSLSDPTMGTQSVLQQTRMNNEGAPTIQVGQEEPTQSRQPDDQDSMVEQVARIVDESREEDTPAEPRAGAGENSTKEDDDPGSDTKDETVLRDRGEDEPSNPKKRMMDEREEKKDVASDDEARERERKDVKEEL